MSSWDHTGNDYSRDFYGSGRPDDLHTDFAQGWPSPWEPPPSSGRSQYQWRKDQGDWRQGRRSLLGVRPSRGGGEPGNPRGRIMPEDHGHEPWDAWRSPNAQPPRAQQPGKRKVGPKPFHNRWDRGLAGPPQDERGAGDRGDNNDRWNRFTRQFGNRHFHREDAEGAEVDLSGSGGSLRASQADSVGLGDSSGSGGGKKRPRSLERERQLSKSSRAENSTHRSTGFLSPGGSRALSLSDLNGGEAQTSTSRPGKVQKGQAGLPTGSATSASAAPSAKAPDPAGKKKQAVPKHKAAGAVPGSKAADRAGKVGGEPGGDTSGEGVLERAERMCQELRDKRQQAAHVRSASSGQRVATLRNALNTSARRFNSAHKSFIRGYTSDSSSVPSTTTGGLGTPASVTPRKHFSSSCEPHNVMEPKNASSAAAGLQDSQTSAVTHSSVSSSSSQVSDIERIRHSIESSVVAEGKTGRLTVSDRSLSGNRSPAASTSSSATQGLPTATGAVGNKLPLSKDALAKMVNTPRSRTQRVQLARMLRQHTAAAMTRPRRIQLDGLYDNTNDGDSIQDVLKNISGLEEIGDCAELKDIKLEDLTNEDKLRIAQLIEDVDITDRDHHQPVGNEYGVGITAGRGGPPSNSSRRGRAESSDKEAEVSDQNDHFRSPQRLQAASPTPSMPLCLDDLNTESSRQEAPAVRSLSPVRSTLMRSPPPRCTPVHSHSQSSPRATPVGSPFPPRPASATAVSVRDVGDISMDSGAVVDPVAQQPCSRASPNFRSGREAECGPISSPLRSPVPMEVSDVPLPDPVSRSVAGKMILFVLTFCQNTPVSQH